jgi:predicted ABC-type ATPase
VVTRVSEGGQDVPGEKICGRFPRTLLLIRQAALIADRTFVFDNSMLDRTLTWVMTLECGRVLSLAENVPAWVREVYAEEISAATEALSPKTK